MSGLMWKLSGEPVELQRLVGIDGCTDHRGLCPAHEYDDVPDWWRHRVGESEADQ